MQKRPYVCIQIYINRCIILHTRIVYSVYIHICIQEGMEPTVIVCLYILSIFVRGSLFYVTFGTFV